MKELSASTPCDYGSMWRSSWTQTYATLEGSGAVVKIERANGHNDIIINLNSWINVRTSNATYSTDNRKSLTSLLRSLFPCYHFYVATTNINLAISWAENRILSVVLGRKHE